MRDLFDISRLVFGVSGDRVRRCLRNVQIRFPGGEIRRSRAGLAAVDDDPFHRPVVAARPHHVLMSALLARVRDDCRGRQIDDRIEQLREVDRGDFCDA